VTLAHSSWGPGWPNCNSSLIESNFGVDGTRFPGGIRNELVDLVTMLVRETKNRGYRFGNSSDPSYGCWGFSCRAISGSNNPSNHSWGLAVDINAPSNPYTSPLVTDMPSWMPDLWNQYGFRWGGDYSGSQDAMHYEFMGSVTDAANETAKARSNGLGGGAPPTPEPPTDWLDMATQDEVRAAFADALAGDQNLSEIRRMIGVLTGYPGGADLENSVGVQVRGALGDELAEIRRMTGVAIGYPPGSGTEHNLAQQG
jgi:hypothetical protein